METTIIYWGFIRVILGYWKIKWKLLFRVESWKIWEGRV